MSILITKLGGVRERKRSSRLSTDFWRIMIKRTGCFLECTLVDKYKLNSSIHHPPSIKIHLCFRGGVHRAQNSLIWLKSVNVPNKLLQLTPKLVHIQTILDSYFFEVRYSSQVGFSGIGFLLHDLNHLF